MSSVNSKNVFFDELQMISCIFASDVRNRSWWGIMTVLWINQSSMSARNIVHLEVSKTAAQGQLLTTRQTVTRVSRQS